MGFASFIDPILLETVSVGNDNYYTNNEFEDGLVDQTGIIW